jgi:rhodanese-related sulfurtransferase
MTVLARMLTQTLGLVLLAAALGLVVNALRPDGLPLLQAGESLVELEQGAETIPLKDAIVLFATGRAVFVDARSPAAYAASHVQGAVSLPPDAFQARFPELESRLRGPETVIAYCDGSLCPLAERVAALLRERGVDGVRVLENGWPRWQAENLPVEGGDPAGAETLGELERMLDGEEDLCTECE